MVIPGVTVAGILFNFLSASVTLVQDSTINHLLCIYSNGIKSEPNPHMSDNSTKNVLSATANYIYLIIMHFVFFFFFFLYVSFFAYFRFLSFIITIHFLVMLLPVSVFHRGNQILELLYFFR